MTDQYAAGSVWWGQMDFGRGRGMVKKYFVLLSDCPASGKQAPAALATSKGAKHYPQSVAPKSPCGCPQESCFRIDEGQEGCFPLTTWVQLDANVKPISRASLEQLEKEGRAGYVQPLDPGRFRALLNCAKESLDLEGWVLSLVRETQKALKPGKQAASTAKQTAAPGKPSAVLATMSSAQATVPSTGLASVRNRYMRLCVVCREKVVNLLLLTEGDFTAILSSSRPTPAQFLSDFEDGLNIVRPECGTCSQLRL